MYYLKYVKLIIYLYIYVKLKYVKLIVCLNIYWILSPKNILRERKNDFGLFKGQKFISVFLNIIILTKYQNNKIILKK